LRESKQDWRPSLLSTIKTILNKYLYKNKKQVFACFVDFSKAFDSLSHEALFQKLYTLGIKGIFFRARIVINLLSTSICHNRPWESLSKIGDLLYSLIIKVDHQHTIGNLVTSLDFDINKINQLLTDQHSKVTLNKLQHLSTQEHDNKLFFFANIYQKDFILQDYLSLKLPVNITQN
jgi:hypothetical protein